MPYKDPKEKNTQQSKVSSGIKKIKQDLKMSGFMEENKKKCVEYQINWRKNNPEKY